LPLNRATAPRLTKSHAKLRTELHRQTHRHLDFDAPDRHAFDVDAERDAEIAAAGDEVGNRGESQPVGRVERVGRVSEVVLDPTRDVNAA
jgi:hypothetical protein